ncbi:MAG: SDR family oxidoreductase [Verrucomicrobia bacterium]|nr:SDR family oxidoreductase [Verrucomicrobiota bacterium]MCF7707758.1 SDR family oxidoreductase [Verrucomicrobiota bacterium]
MDIFNLKDEVAVVIGATGVLGGAIAKGLAAAGAKVAVVGRNENKGAACENSIKEAGGEARFITTDVVEKESVVSLKDKVRELFGTPAILVNAAGGNDPKATVVPDHPFEDVAIEDWNKNYNLNLIGGALIPCQVFGPMMCDEKKGSIINIASVAGHLPLSRVVAYSAAKAAMLNLTKFLAREWAPAGVRVNSITPGFFPAEQNRRLLFNEDGTPTARAQSILGHTPMSRFGESQELVGAAVFLASQQASGFVTGIDLRVDGGFLSQTI